MIDQPTIERILDIAHVEDVISEFVTLRRRGVNFVGLCPFHNEKTPSFTVSPAKGLWKCFGCGKGGNAVHFIMEHEQLSYYEALKWLAHKYGIEIRERELSDSEREAQDLRESLFVINEFARDYFRDTLYNNKEGQTIGLPYFRHRGFRDDIMKKFQLGYCPEKNDAFAQEALKRGFKKELLDKTGLCILQESGRLRDRFWGRVIFPVHTLSGKIVAFGGRVMQTDAKTAKYLNSPESEIYHKSNQLYGIYFAKQEIVRKDRCYLVEGYTDVISMHQAGVENVVASSGTSLTPGQIRLIHRFTNNITVLYDGDFAGIKASVRGIDMLLDEGMNVKVVLLPEGEDPDSFSRSRNATEYQTYLKEHETDFIRFKTNLLLKDVGDDPIKRASLVSEIVKSISVIPNDIVRAEYIKECSELLRVQEQLLVSETDKERKQRQKEGFRPKESADESAVTEVNKGDEQIPETTVSPDLVQAYTPQNALLHSKESLIITNIIRYGEKKICAIEGEEKELRVIEFIANDLEQEGLKFSSPVYQQVLEEACAHLNDIGFVAEKYFLSHPNPEISRLAADLSSDRYQLSKYHSKLKELPQIEEKLYSIVTNLLVEYKLTLVNDELQTIVKELQKPENATNEQCYGKMMKRYMELKELQQVIAKRLGDRVIN